MRAHSTRLCNREDTQNLDREVSKRVGRNRMQIQGQNLLKCLSALGIAGGALFVTSTPPAQTLVARTSLDGTIFGEAIAVKSAIAQGRRLPARDPQQVPTARYGRGEAVDLSLIVEEWRDRYPAIPVYTCSCRAESCGDPDAWPFRSFTRYQPFLALGAVNAAKNEGAGFNCFDIETGDRPE